MLTLEENVAGVGEDTKVLEQEYPVQDSFEQGKLPLTCMYATIFKMVLHQEFSRKRTKPCQLCVTRYFATTHNEEVELLVGNKNLRTRVMIQH